MNQEKRATCNDYYQMAYDNNTIFENNDGTVSAYYISGGITHHNCAIMDETAFIRPSIFNEFILFIIILFSTLILFKFNLIHNQLK